MREFKYEVRDLIQCIRERPCLWDKTTEIYKDRVERRTAWEQIFNILDERYEEMTPEEKRITGETILNKWTNIRDTFMKTLKNRMGKPKRRYLFYDDLKFLTKIKPEENPIEDNNDDSYMKQDDEDPKPIKTSKRKLNSFDELKSTNPESLPYEKQSGYDLIERTLPETSQSKRKAKKNSKSVPECAVDDVINFVELDEVNDARVMNEDEAFFASLLPTVVKYSEDERLDFRMEVLGVMKKIKGRRKWTDDSAS